MTDVFISYARADQPFVRTLNAALAARQREAWVDWDGIPPTAEWLAEIRAAIAAADAFVFVISPDAVASEVCALELDHAVRQNKRLVPVLRRDAAGRPVPDALARLNWIFMREQDPLDAAADTLVAALDTDLAHVKLHTHTLTRALHWEHQGHDGGDLLRGRDLAAAEQWLADSGGRPPQPTALQHRFILDSRRATTRRQRLAATAVGAGMLVATVLGLLALQQREARRQNEQRAIANQLVGESRLALDERDDGLADSVALAAQAMHRLATLGERSLAADQALRRGLSLLPAPPVVVRLDAPAEIRAVDFAADGAHAAIADALGGVALVALDGPRTVASWMLAPETGSSVRAVAVDATATRVALWRYAAGTDRSRLSVWDAARGVELGGCDVDGDFGGHDAALGPGARLWLEGRAVRRLADCRPWDLWGADTLVGAVALDGTGQRIAASVRARGDRQRWIDVRDAETGERLARWPHDGTIARLAWIDSDRRLRAVDLGGRRVRTWDLARPGASGASGTPAMVPLAEPLLALGTDAVATRPADGATVRIRDAATGAERLRLVHPGAVRAAAFGADGRTLYALVGRDLWRWSVVPPAVAPDAGAAFLPAAADIVVPDAVQAQLRRDGLSVLAAAPCPDVRTLAVTAGRSTRGGWQASTTLWSLPGATAGPAFDLAAGLGPGRPGLGDRAAALLACSADGGRIALPAQDAVLVRTVADGRQVARLSHPGVHAAAFAPDAAFVATAGRGPVRVWSLATGTEVARLLDDGPVEGLGFSADGRWLQTVGPDGRAVHRWQPQTLMAAACARLPGPLPAATWERLFPGVAPIDPCAPGAPGAADAAR
jgi:WD40 repeat protein